MPLGSEYRIDVLDSFRALQTALTVVDYQLTKHDNKLPSWFQPPVGLPLAPHLSERQKVIAMIKQLEYLDHQKPREILVGAGVLAASEATLDAIHQLNQAKDRFKAAILALKAAKIPVSDPYLTEHIEPSLDKRSTTTTHALRKMGLSRLHLKQCYRTIPILPDRPSKISWTWANTRAITRITVQEAEQLLLKQGTDAGIEHQLSKLYSLQPHVPLAIVQELAPHLRVNIVLHNANNETVRMMLKGPIPLFYPAKEELPLPVLRPPKDKQGKNLNRPIRSDVKLDPEPFLPAIRVHRYIR